MADRLKRLIKKYPDLVVGYTPRGRPVFAVSGGDDVIIDNGGQPDFTASTDTIAGKEYQRVKLVDGTDGSTAEIQGSAANGLEVDVTRIATGAKIQLTDGTSDATVRNLAANDALNVAIVDGAGNHVTSFAGSGGTASADDADMTPGTTPGTPIMGVFESAPTSITDGDMGIVGVTATRALKVDVTSSALDLTHDSVDGSSAPVKIGSRAQNVLPTAVANNDRVNQIADLFGRMLTSHIAPEMQVWKSANYTSTQTGTTIWDPTAGKRIAITHLQVDSYGTTAGRIILWFGANADVTYTAGSDQPVFIGSHAPSTTSKPGALPPINVPLFCLTPDHELHITTDAAISLDVVVYGYEF